MPSIHAEQLSRLRAIIKAEVEKPGSRGGVVIGFRPNGAPIYASSLRAEGSVVRIQGNELGAFDQPEHLKRKVREHCKKYIGRQYRNLSSGKDIKVTRTGIGKATNGKRSAEELLSLYYIPELLVLSKYKGHHPDRKNREEVKAVHYFEKDLQTKSGVVQLIIVVREVPEGHLFYDSHEVIERAASKAGNQAPAEAYNPPASAAPIVGHSTIDQNGDESQPEKRKSLILGPIIGMTIQKAKGLGQRRCPFCQGWKGTVVRVFESYDDFASSPYYGGGDLVINDPHATRAVWPGKDNVGRSADDWWICIPVHPYCGCHWHPWSPPVEEEEDDPWVQFRRRGKEGATQEDNRRAFQEERARFRAENPHLFKSAAVTHGQQLALLREAIRTPAFRKSTTEVSGVFHHHTCAHEEETESWTRSYLRSRRTA